MAQTQNKIFILITGCSSGIGRASAHYMKARGFTVIATVRSEKDRESLLGEGIEHVVILDLRYSQSIDACVKQVADICHSNLFAVFNNAAFGQPGAVEDISRQVLREQFEVNVFGTHELTCKLLPLMLHLPDARIVQNSSILGFAAMPSRGSYNASKFALEGLSDTLRLELAVSSNVKVVLIEPGPIESMFRDNAVAKFIENVDIENSRLSDRYKATLSRLEGANDKRGASAKFKLPAEAVAKKLYMACTEPKPKARYYVTFPTYLFAFLRHVLPQSWLDKLLIRAGDS